MMVLLISSLSLLVFRHECMRPLTVVVVLRGVFTSAHVPGDINNTTRTNESLGLQLHHLQSIIRLDL